jgi:hypothetical protein
MGGACWDNEDVDDKFFLFGHVRVVNVKMSSLYIVSMVIGWLLTLRFVRLVEVHASWFEHPH